MGIKSILTLFAVGGIAAGAFYFRDGIQESFASGKGKITDAKQTLQEGYRTPITEPVNIETSKPVDKTQEETLVYVPIYQNNGTISVPEGETKPNENTKNPTIQEYITESNAKTEATISQFTSQSNIENIASYEKQKYGIDDELLIEAVSKPASKRTTEEQQQIENEKARAIFDSRSISNW